HDPGFRALLTVADGQFGDRQRVVGLAHRGDELADADVLAFGRGLADTGLEPFLDGLDGLVEFEPALKVLFGSPPGLRIEDSVGDLVEHPFLGHTPQALTVLHERNRVGEGLEVADKVAGERRSGAPAATRTGLTGGHAGAR